MRTFFIFDTSTAIGWLRREPAEAAPVIGTVAAPATGKPEVVPQTSAYILKRRMLRRRASGYRGRAEGRM